MDALIDNEKADLVNSCLLPSFFFNPSMFVYNINCFAPSCSHLKVSASVLNMEPIGSYSEFERRYVNDTSDQVEEENCF